MSLVDKVVDFITNELMIDINEENKNKKIYPDIEDKFYWSCSIVYSIYEGIVSKDEYEEIKRLQPETFIHFAEIAKYVDDECELKDILPFTDDINEIKNFYDKGGENSNNYFDLMGYLYDSGKFNGEED